MGVEEDFFDAHNAFLLTNYQKALKLLQKINTKDVELKKRIEILTYKVYIAQKKFGVIFDEIKPTENTLELKLLRLLALLLSDFKEKENVVKNVDDLMTGNVDLQDSTALLIAATIYLDANMPEAALRTLHQGNDIMCDAFSIQCFLKLHRYDLAGKTVRRMQTADEDALPTQLASALFFLTQGGDKLQEALHQYQELQEKHGANPYLLNGQAVAYMGMNRWEEAEPLLREAMDLEPNHVETLVNCVVVAQHTGKPSETINRFISQLKDSNSEHIFLTEYAAKEEEFDRLCCKYAPSVIV